MAVIKSSSLGQVRKSIGATNYYRRAGVQLARSKPTFAPGRTFTPAQLDQQWRMQVSQYLLLTVGLGKCSNCANVINNRLYNASSRYNRMVQKIMNNTWEYDRSEFPDPANAWSNGWDSIAENWSIGDVKGVPSKVEILLNISNVRIRVYGLNNIAAEMIRLTNKRRKDSGKLTEENIGVCGLFEYQATGSNKTYVQLPVFNLNTPSTGSDYYEFSLDITMPVTASANYWYNLVFFIADGVNSSIPAVDLVALHCTDSTGWQVGNVVNQ